MSVEEITWDQLQGEVLPKGGLTILDTYMERCAPCVALAPVLQAVAHDLAGSVRVIKMDIMKNPTVYQAYGLQKAPTLLFFKDGKPVDRLVGGEATRETILGKANLLLAPVS